MAGTEGDAACRAEYGRLTAVKVRAATPAVAGTSAVPMTTAGRLVRASAFAGTSVSLAVAAHATAGGHRPATILLSCAFGLLTRVAYGLAGRERRIGAMLAGVGFAQLALHATFAITSHGTGMAAQALLPEGLAMATAHATAAGLVSGMLSQAENGLWTATTLRLAVARFRAGSRAAGLLMRAARWFATALSTLLACGQDSPHTRPGTPGRHLPAPPQPSVSLGGRLFVRAGGRRGPPLVLSAAAA